jgi:hypothetical protein
MLMTLVPDSCNEQFDACQKVYPVDSQNGLSFVSDRT